MDKNLLILKWSLFFGGVYFFFIAIAHMLYFKIPFFYIYYNVPSMVYQDKIISFLSFGWSIFFFTGYLNPKKNFHLIISILIAGFCAIVGLTIINISTNFETLDPNLEAYVFWQELFGLIIYLCWLAFFTFRSKSSFTEK